MQAKLARAPSEQCGIERKASTARNAAQPATGTDPRGKISRGDAAGERAIESGPATPGNVPSRTPVRGRSFGPVRCRYAQRHRQSDIVGAEPRAVPPDARIAGRSRLGRRRLRAPLRRRSRYSARVPTSWTSPRARLALCKAPAGSIRPRAVRENALIPSDREWLRSTGARRNRAYSLTAARWLHRRTGPAGG